MIERKQETSSQATRETETETKLGSKDRNENGVEGIKYKEDKDR